MSETKTLSKSVFQQKSSRPVSFNKVKSKTKKKKDKNKTIEKNEKHKQTNKQTNRETNLTFLRLQRIYCEHVLLQNNFTD